MSITRILPADTGGTTGNLCFVVTDTETGKQVNLQARQIPIIYSTPCLVGGSILTCQFYRTYMGKRYYRSHPDTDPDGWPSPNPCNGILLYPDKPANDWFNIPLSLNGAQMPTAHSPSTITLRHAGALAQNLGDYVFESAPASPDDSSTPKIRIIDSPSVELNIVGSVTVGNGIPTEVSAGYSAQMNAGGTLHYGGSDSYNPSAVYAVYDPTNSVWSISLDVWESYRNFSYSYDIKAVY